MSKYNIYSTKEDYKKVLDELSQLDAKHGLNLDFKKLKRMRYDPLYTVLGTLKQAMIKA